MVVDGYGKCVRSMSGLSVVKRLYSKGSKSKKIIVDSSHLEFSDRNGRVLSNLSQYYPSLSDSSYNKQTVSISRFNSLYGGISQDMPVSQVSVNGRIKNIRFSGKKICFIDLINNFNQQLQLIVNYHIVDSGCRNEFEFHDSLHFLKNGDYINSVGFPGLSKSKLRTVSLKCIRIPTLLAPAQLPLPPKLSDYGKIKNNRVIDYQVNGVQTILLRSFIIKKIRSFLDGQDFVEVETPILSSQSNGAVARPFTTVLDRKSSTEASRNNLQLRIAPELWLKRLVIGGLDRVYELGKVFRNEGIDQTHNPEFTTLEFYQAYASMEDLVNQAEQMFKFLILSLHDSEIIKHTPDCQNVVQSLHTVLEKNNWKFNRVEFLSTLTKEVNNNVDFTKIDLTDPKVLLDSIPQDTRSLLFPISTLSNISPQQVLNKLCAHYIEKRHCNTLLPTLIFNHPMVMSPLAKSDSTDPTITKRFELFINGTEYMNAYEEENCPQLQYDKFLQQKKSNELYNDKEALSVDENYINAMKWGMPPIGGLGLGIDRLCMLLLQKERIEEVLSFGTLDDVNRQ